MFLNADAVPGAVARIAGKTPVGNALKAVDLRDLALALRERGQFSARVESVKFMRHVQDSLAQAIATGRKDIINVNTGEADTVLMDRGRFIADAMDQATGLPTAGPGIADIHSFRRLALIFDQQTKSAYGYTDWKTGQSPDLLDVFPAQRLARHEVRKEPRDWEERWQEAGAAVGWEGASQDEMVALKSSPIWAELSAFDEPWPPFDYDSGMGVDDVDRQEAQSLGLLEPGQMPEGDSERDFNDDLAASVDDADQHWLAEWFGDQVRLSPGRVEWAG